MSKPKLHYQWADMNYPWVYSDSDYGWPIGRLRGLTIIALVWVAECLIWIGSVLVDDRQ